MTGGEILGLILLACLIAGILPGIFIDALAPAVNLGTGARMPVQTTLPWLSIVPIAEGRSSYNGLLVFAFEPADAARQVQGDLPAGRDGG